MFNSIKKCLKEIFCCLNQNKPKYMAIHINPGELIVDVIELVDS
jgi:hypothetical protein